MAHGLKKRAKSRHQRQIPVNLIRINTRLIALYSDETVALRKYESAVTKNPKDSMANYGYGLVLARIGNRKDAAVYIKRALEREAFNPEFLFALGRIYFLDGQYEKALTILESAVSIAPDDPEGLFYLGRTQMELGRLENAETTSKNSYQNTS